MPQPSFDLAKAQRWFAVEFNNEAWGIVEGTDRSAATTERLLHLAHGACLHWGAAGTAINRQRALDLLAHAYAVAGMASMALRFAEEALRLSETNRAEQTPFDRAEARGTMAVALCAAGRAADAEPWRQQALAAVKELPADEQEVIERLLQPWR